MKKQETKKRHKRPDRLAEIDANRLYPISVFLKRLGVCRNTLVALRRRGFPVHTIADRKIFIDGAEAIAFFRKEWANRDGSSQDTSGQADQHAE